jgi:hypothetical protein
VASSRRTRRIRSPDGRSCGRARWLHDETERAAGRRKREEQAAKVRGEKLERYLQDGEPRNDPAPELVPDDGDKTAVLREYRRLARLAAGEPVGTPKRDLLLDKTAVQLARLVFIERVLALEESDPLAHAALSAVDLVRLSVISPAEIRRRLDDLQDAGVPR